MECLLSSYLMYASAVRQVSKHSTWKNGPRPWELIAMHVNSNNNSTNNNSNTYNDNPDTNRKTTQPRSSKHSQVKIADDSGIRAPHFEFPQGLHVLASNLGVT